MLIPSATQYGVTDAEPYDKMLNQDIPWPPICWPHSLSIWYNARLHIQCPEGLQGFGMGNRGGEELLPLLDKNEHGGATFLLPSLFLSPFPLFPSILPPFSRQKKSWSPGKLTDFKMFTRN